MNTLPNSDQYILFKDTINELAQRKKNILDRWNITVDELTEVIDDNPSLRGMIIGYLGEAICRKKRFTCPEITKCVKYDDHDRRNKSDLGPTYKHHDLRIEVKSLQTNSIRKYIDQNEKVRYIGKAQVDASDRRKVQLPNGEEIETSLLLFGEFDILAVCLFGFDDKWKFAFARNRDLPATKYKKYPKNIRKYLIASMVEVKWPLVHPFRSDPFSIMDEIIAEKGFEIQEPDELNDNDDQILLF